MRQKQLLCRPHSSRSGSLSSKTKTKTKENALPHHLHNRFHLFINMINDHHHAQVSQRHMTLIWCLSPLVGFFLTPIMGRYDKNKRANTKAKGQIQRQKGKYKGKRANKRTKSLAASRILKCLPAPDLNDAFLSLSDRCNSALGRRRPFIILLSVSN